MVQKSKMIKKDTKEKKPSFIFFALVFTVLAVLIIVQNFIREKTIFLFVSNNAGVTVLETVGDRLVCVFHDGQVAVWDWDDFSEQQADFKLETDQVVLPDAQQLAAVNETGRKMLSVYDLLTGEKQIDISVGYEDQVVWPRISFDKSRLALIRKNPADSAETVLYEFLTVDIDNGILGIPVLSSLQANSEMFVDYAVDGKGILYAVGSQNDIGRIMAINLETGKNVWDRIYGPAQEFCSVIVSPGSGYLLAGNRNGVLYKLSTETGEIVKPIQLLEEGEGRPVTNDYSVLNLAFSPDGQYYVVTINPKAYFLKTGTDDIFHIATPADRLVSRIAFSPDNRYFAASDVRAGYPVKIWPMPQNE
jgi:WD40 repeat protein